MKVILAEDRTIKGRKFEAGDEVIVNKEVGTRMVDEGIANRVIDVVENRVVEQPENRMKAVRYSGHKKIFQGTNGKKYVQQGADYVEIEE